MKAKYKIVTAPQFGVNDESATMIEWCNKSNEKVNKDDLLCILESTKATFEDSAPDSGYITILVSEGETIEVNQDIAIIVFDEALVDEIIKSYKKEKIYKEPKLSITKKAQRLAEKNNIGDGCHLAPGCVLGSSIEINDYCILGIGSSISTKVKIGKGCIISLNTSVLNDIADNSLVEGVPGKIIGKTII